jgi:hypothetical protein
MNEYGSVKRSKEDHIIRYVEGTTPAINWDRIYMAVEWTADREVEMRRACSIGCGASLQITLSS